MRKIVDNFEEYALLLLFPLMVAVVFTATLARYLNLFPMFWGEEVAGTSWSSWPTSVRGSA